MTIRKRTAAFALLLSFASIGTAHANLVSAITGNAAASVSDSGKPVSSKTNSNQSAAVSGSAPSMNVDVANKEAVSAGNSASDKFGSVRSGTDTVGSVISTSGSNAPNKIGRVSVLRSDLPNADAHAAAQTNVSGNMSGAGAQGTSTSSNSSDTESFKALLQTTMHSDVNLDAVTTDQHGMDVRYREHGHILGIIPMNLFANIHIAPDGAVTVRYPWYHYLMTMEHSADELTTALSVAVTSVNGANASVMGTGATNVAESPAKLFSRIQSILRGDIPASALSSH